MFTGIIEAVAPVSAVEGPEARRRLWLDLSGLADFDVIPGASVNVSGACLTAAEVKGAQVGFDCVTETLARTTLGGLRAGMHVNVERALHPGDRLGGHLVQGHVDGVGTVDRLHPQPGQTLLHLHAPELVDQMVIKGSVAVDGVSLTVVDLTASGLAVALVPFTLEHTTLGERRPGDRVNIEADLIGKYVRAHLAGFGGGPITEDFLREQGFA
jgi:riboflavin synthase